MDLNHKSVNVQKKDLVEHAVLLLTKAESFQSPNQQHSSVALAHAYLKAAELMQSGEPVVYIDLGERYVPR